MKSQTSFLHISRLIIGLLFLLTNTMQAWSGIKDCFGLLSRKEAHPKPMPNGYAFVYNTSDTNVPHVGKFDNIEFNANTLLDGWNLLNKNTFTNTYAGTYLVAFTATIVNNGNTAPVTMAFRGVISGAEINGSQIETTAFINSSQAISKVFIINISDNQMINMQFCSLTNSESVQHDIVLTSESIAIVKIN